MPVILFDFDGVLADTMEDVLAFGQEACAQLGFECHPSPADLDALDTMSVADYGRQLKLPPEYIEEFISRYLQLFIQKTTPPKLFPGMERVISQAAKNNALAIITGNSTLTVEAFLKEHKLHDYIKLVLGAEKKASRAEKIRSALRNLGKPAETAWMVGDSISDIRAAQETSLKSVAVTWGHQSPSRLQKAGPDYLVHSPEDLADLLKNGLKRD